MSAKSATLQTRCAAFACGLTMQPIAAMNGAHMLHNMKRVATSRSIIGPLDKRGEIGDRRPLAVCVDIDPRSRFPLKSRHISKFRGTTIHSLSRAAVFCAFSIIPLMAMAEPLSVPPPPKAQNTAESVRVQPRGDAFVPNSPQEDAVQKGITTFNARQELLDEAFDRKLRICRGC
jgi:hypothetical protein